MFLLVIIDFHSFGNCFYYYINDFLVNFKTMYKTKKKFINFNSIIIHIFLILILFIQITIGAFVSGLDAGHIYQTWPKMNHTYFPDDVEIKSLKDFLILIAIV